MLPDRVSNPGPLTYESGALPIALRGPALIRLTLFLNADYYAIFLAICRFCNQTFSRVKTDFECSRSKVEICYKSPQDFTSQKRGRQSMHCFYVYCIMSNTLELFDVLFSTLSRRK